MSDPPLDIELSGLHPVDLPMKFLEILGGYLGTVLCWHMICRISPLKISSKKALWAKNCLKTTQLLTRFHSFWSTLENFPKFLANWPLASILQKLCTASYRFSLNDNLIQSWEFRYLIAWSYLTSGILKSLAVWLPRFGSMIEIIGQKIFHTFKFHYLRQIIYWSVIRQWNRME